MSLVYALRNRLLTPCGNGLDGQLLISGFCGLMREIRTVTRVLLLCDSLEFLLKIYVNVVLERRRRGEVDICRGVESTVNLADVVDDLQRGIKLCTSRGEPGDIRSHEVSH